MIIVRADGNSTIGAGHIMRCLSVADVLRDRGATCVFVTAGPEMAEIIRNAGFETRTLGTDYRHMEDELPALKGLLWELKAELLIADSYFVTENYFREFSDVVRTVYIDDLAAAAYHVDMLINYNLFAKEDRYRALYERTGERRPELLIGTEYVPLRREFRDYPFRELRKRIANVLVSTGGADHEHVALRYLQHLAQSEEMRRYRFHFVLGAMNKDAEEIERLAASQKNVEVHRRVTRMYDLMSHCDAAISASGSTMYELCASSVPIISYVLADNQQEIAREFHNRGAALYAGDIRQDRNFAETFDGMLTQIATDYDRRIEMTHIAHDLVDGKGTRRIADAIWTLSERSGKRREERKEQ